MVHSYKKSGPREDSAFFITLKKNAVEAFTQTSLCKNHLNFIKMIVVQG